MKPETSVSPVFCQNSLRNVSFRPVKKRSPRLSVSEKLMSEAKTFGKRDVRETASRESGGPFEGLPSMVKELFSEHRGIESLYDWQKECLCHPSVVNGKNLILSLPTSGGKTLIAEILILKKVLVEKKDTVLILPFVSIVHEKIKSFVPFGLALDFLIEEYAGSKGRFPPIKRRKKNSLYVCTIEKGQSLINSLIENGQVGNLGLVVIDELHMLGEAGGRGAALEQNIAKILFAAPTCQIIGMSATLSNICDLQRFLNAELYCCEFRPVELKEYVKFGNSLVEIQAGSSSIETVYGKERLLEPSTNAKDPDGVIDLILEVIPGSSCLVFCSTKKNAQNVAVLTARLLSKELKKYKTEEKLALLSSLREECENNLCPDLERCIPYGVAYHHSGLTAEERKLIQDAFLDGTLCVICCTSTLAAGVNLPAKRVIIRSPFVGSCLLSRGQYKQMIGRAGRAGLDICGESITILQKNNQLEFTRRLVADFEKCESKLMTENARGIRSLFLSLFALKILRSKEDAKLFLRSTLLGVQSKEMGINTDAIAGRSVQELLDRKMLKENLTDSCIETTSLGNAAYKGPVDVELVNHLYGDLMNCMRNGMVLATHLHLICCVVPYEGVLEVVPNWELFYKEFCSLTCEERKVLELQGFNEGHIVQRLSSINAKMKTSDSTIRRFYLALMLNHLWKRNKVWDVAHLFGVSRGWIQNLLQTTASFASCVSRFCEQIPELWPFQCLLPNFVKQLCHCREMELLPLLDIQGVKQGRARQLYAAGYKSVVLLARSDPEELMKKIEHLSRKQARQIVASSKMLLEEERAAQIEQLAELFIPGSNDNNENLISSMIEAIS